jgi:hypothetical protein
MAARQYVVAHIIVGAPDTNAAETCETCGFDSLLRFPLKHLTEQGVSDAGSVKACSRCYDEGEVD